jgi:hypothetical protein
MTDATGLRTLLSEGALDLPPIGEGSTASRWRALSEIARQDVSTGRLAEAHVDGRQILHEANYEHPCNRLLGVWASDHPRHIVTADEHAGRVVLHGSKAFCSGTGIIDDALLSAVTPAGPVLLLVALDELETDRLDLSQWRTSALAATRTAIVDFEGVSLPIRCAVGQPGWYLHRPGFWHGAIGPAACWAGAASGLVDHILIHAPSDPHGRAHLGAMVSARWSNDVALAAAGAEIDHDVRNAHAARQRALIVRHLIDEHCRGIQDRFGRALGPRPLVNDVAVAERYEALTIYRRQCHAERDLEVLASLVSTGDRV